MYQDVHWLQARGSSESTFGFAYLSYTEQSAAFIFFLLMEEQVVHNAFEVTGKCPISKSCLFYFRFVSLGGRHFD